MNTARHLEEPSLLASARESSRRILVVEDDEDLLAAVIRVASSLGSSVEVDGAPDLEEARQLLDAGRYDLILADYYFEGSERGASLILESLASSPSTGVAMMSALPLPDFLRVVDRELPAGVQILPKPFSAVELRVGPRPGIEAPDAALDLSSDTTHFFSMAYDQLLDRSLVHFIQAAGTDHAESTAKSRGTRQHRLSDCGVWQRGRSQRIIRQMVIALTLETTRRTLDESAAVWRPHHAASIAGG